MKKHELITIALLLAATPLAAQQATRECSTREAVGYIGISGISCNCTIGAVDKPQDWSFRTEPRITSLEADTRAGALLKIGDVITAVNGKLITTREGATELADIKPGEAVVLTVRRNGETLKYAITAGSACPNDSRLLGFYAPSATPELAPPATPAAVPAAPRVWSSTRTPPPSAPPAMYAPAMPPMPYMGPRASFGLSFSCSNCTMQFQEKTHTWSMDFGKPPEVYYVEHGGPADKAGIRRGDLITQINGKRIDSDEGGRIFASTKPGQTVKFTVLRNNRRQTFSVRAGDRGTLPPSLASTSRALAEAGQSLQEIQRAQQEQMRRLQEASGRDMTLHAEEMRAEQRRLLEQEREHSRQLAALSGEVARANSEMARAAIAMRAAMADSAHAICSATAIAPVAPGSASRGQRTLRYTGSLSGTDIEVRGAPVSVSETEDEIVITTGATVVRVQRKK